MGQYYKAVCLDNKEQASPWDFESGAKLMEHSFIDNYFCTEIQWRLLETENNKGKWARKRIVWAGDYADNEDNKDYNLFDLSETKFKKINKNYPEKFPKEYKYLINWDDNEYIDMYKYVINENDFYINSLPLLTCEGNGRGGGDYYGINEDYVGIWARKKLSISNKYPDNFEEFKIKFKDV